MNSQKFLWFLSQYVLKSPSVILHLGATVAEMFYVKNLQDRNFDFQVMAFRVVTEAFPAIPKFSIILSAQMYAWLRVSLICMAGPVLGPLHI